MEDPPMDAKVDNTYCPACQEKLLNYCGYRLRDDCDMRSDEPDSWDGYTLAWSLYSDKPHFLRHAVYACHPDKHTKESARLWAVNQAFDEALVQFKFLRNELETEEFKQRMKQGMNHHVPLCQRCIQ